MKNWRSISIIALSVALSACGAGGGGSSGHEAGHSPGGSAETPAAGGHGGHGGHEQAPDGGEAGTAGQLHASFSFKEGAATAGAETELQVRIADHEGNPVNDFEVNHEKLLHLIVVSRDLSVFQHIHPEFEGDGLFAVDTTFPSGGVYKAFADFIPSGGSAATLSDWITVEGEQAAEQGIAADKSLRRQVDGKEVGLSLSTTRANEDATLTFDIRDAATQEGIDDLEPYLGAVGHVVILSADAEQYLHVHPIDESSTGPQAQFATAFPSAGTYKIWGQFQHEGQVFTVPFVVEIE